MPPSSFDPTDPFYRFRYGMTSADKARLAYSRALPGAPPYTESPANADRYASTYLFSKQWPNIGPPLARGVNTLYGALGDPAARSGLAGVDAATRPPMPTYPMPPSRPNIPRPPTAVRTPPNPAGDSRTWFDENGQEWIRGEDGRPMPVFRSETDVLNVNMDPRLNTLMPSSSQGTGVNPNSAEGRAARGFRGGAPLRPGDLTHDQIVRSYMIESGLDPEMAGGHGGAKAGRPDTWATRIERKEDRDARIQAQIASGAVPTPTGYSPGDPRSPRTHARSSIYRAPQATPMETVPMQTTANQPIGPRPPWMTNPRNSGINPNINNRPIDLTAPFNGPRGTGGGWGDNARGSDMNVIGGGQWENLAFPDIQAMRPPAQVPLGGMGPGRWGGSRG